MEEEEEAVVAEEEGEEEEEEEAVAMTMIVHQIGDVEIEFEIYNKNWGCY